MAWLWSSGNNDDGPFINTFCSPNLSAADFRNELGGFTPCFTDVIILGTCHACGICCFIFHWQRSLSRKVKHYQLKGAASFWHLTAILTALACAVVPLLQLNARLGAAASGGDSAQPAPFEWTGAGLACCSWLVLLLLLLRERAGHFVRPGRWLVRFAVLLITSGEVVKVRFLLEMVQEQDYFFWLYMVYVGLQIYLSLLSVLSYPSPEQLEVAHEPADGYLPLSGEADAAEAAADGGKPVFPEARANWLSHLTFAYMSSIMAAGYKGGAELPKLLNWRLSPEDEVEALNARFKEHWLAEKAKGEGASVVRACWRTEGTHLLGALPFKLLNDASQFVGPIFLNLMLRADPTDWRCYCYAGAMFLGSLVGSMADAQHFQRTYRVGFRLRSVLSAQVHAMVFRLAPSARSKFSSGRIFSLVSSDVETVQLLLQNIYIAFSSPLRIILAMALLYQNLGPASIVAVVCIVAFIPVNAYLVQWSGRLLKKALGFTDERTKLESELVSGMEVVKCSTWEEPFKKRIESARDQELAMLWRVNVLAAVTQFILFSIPTIIPVATFSVYLLLGNTLTAANAFTALALFTILRFPMFALPQMVAQIIQARVSMVRIQEFLCAETLRDICQLPPSPKGSTAVSMEGDFAWDLNQPPTLVDVKLALPAGSLVVVVGATGSGKSTLLSAMLGLVQQVYGSPPVIHGRVSYVPQAAFIIGATVRENILFGAEYDEARYHAAVEAACLEADFLLMPAGDSTELGDRGVNLSGGQKHRISIARALYSQSDVCLLDDALSALDAKVGRKVFERAIRGVLADKTVVLAINQLQFANHADWVVFMSGGRVVESGPFNDLMAAGKGFASMMKEAQVEQDDTHDAADIEVEGEAVVAQPALAVAPAPARAGGLVESKVSGRLTKDEGMSSGAVSSDVLKAYIAALGGGGWLFFLVAGFVLVESMRVFTTVWLSYWTGTVNDPHVTHGAMFYLTIYAAISGMQLICQFANTIQVTSCGQRAARRLHDTLLGRLLAAPMAFFHTTPGGRIINRLTKDTADVDKQLAPNVSFAFRTLLQLSSTIVLVAVVAPFALPPILVIMLIFYWLYAYFQSGVRQAKRLDAVTRSPVFTSVTEAISGVATIRAFCAEKRLIARHCKLIDDNAVMTLLNQSMNRWLSVRLESLGAFATLLTAVVAVEQRNSADVTGLLLSFTMQITVLTSLTLRMASMAEMSFNAVERVVEYTTIDQEPATGSVTVPPNWPATGVVEFINVHMRYRPGLPLVLRGVSFRVDPLDKVGVVGRTGAGKSSMIGCLFRLAEVETGSIEIDGINIAKIALKQLRSKTAIIPQVPVLFTGSIRLNLSPFGQHSDAELWNALRRAHLVEVVETWPAGLESTLQEDGAPLSAGQKQLLALARALLNPSRLLVLDEATANVDVETDALIQKTMREEFTDRTIFAIAHRLHTIIDYNKVLVLDKGHVAEYGEPAELLKIQDGVFASLVDDTGEATSRFLRNVAQGKQDVAAAYAHQQQQQQQAVLATMARGSAFETAAAAMAAGYGDLLPSTPLGKTKSLGTTSSYNSGGGGGGGGASPPLSSVPMGQLATALLDRSAATAKALKIAVKALSRAAENEDLALLEMGDSTVLASNAELTADVSSARTSFLQAMALMAQVQELAEAASRQTARLNACSQGTNGNLSSPHVILSSGSGLQDSLLPPGSSGHHPAGSGASLSPSKPLSSGFTRLPSGRLEPHGLPTIAQGSEGDGSGSIGGGGGSGTGGGSSLRQLAGLINRQSFRRSQDSGPWGGQESGQH